MALGRLSPDTERPCGHHAQGARPRGTDVVRRLLVRSESRRTSIISCTQASSAGSSDRLSPRWPGSRQCSDLTGCNPGRPSSSRLLIPVTGPAAKIERAFHVSLVRYRLPTGRVAFTSLSAPSISASVAADVVGVVGLSELIQPHDMLAHGAAAPQAAPRAPGLVRAHPRTAGPTPCSPATQSTAGSYTADQLAAYYGMTPLYAMGDFGQGDPHRRRRVRAEPGERHRHLPGVLRDERDRELHPGRRRRLPRGRHGLRGRHGHRGRHRPRASGDHRRLPGAEPLQRVRARPLLGDRQSPAGSPARSRRLHVVGTVRARPGRQRLVLSEQRVEHLRAGRDPGPDGPRRRR